MSRINRTFMILFLTITFLYTTISINSEATKYKNSKNTPKKKITKREKQKESAKERTNTLPINKISKDETPVEAIKNKPGEGGGKKEISEREIPEQKSTELKKTDDRIKEMPQKISTKERIEEKNDEHEEEEEDKLPAFVVGGFLALENEVHQEPNGKLKNLSEINKLRLNFQTYLNKKTHILAEFLPVPEEVTHQIDTLTENLKLDEVDPYSKVVLKTKQAGSDDVAIGNGGLTNKVVFERVQVTFENAYNNQNMRFGQIRLPFGIWEDFTSHRNTTMTKNNALVLGTALRKVDIGGEIYGKAYFTWLDYNFGFIQGKNVRLQDSTRADDDNKKDLFTRISINTFRYFKFGFSGYSVGARNDTGALGADFTIPWGNLTISGEAVYQENRNVKDEFSDKRYMKAGRIQFDRGVNRVSTFRSSESAYLQFNYNLSDILPGLRAYTLFDYWNMYAMDQQIPITRKVYGGLKYKFIPEGATLTLEHGRNFHNGIDKGEQHYDIQLEISF